MTNTWPLHKLWFNPSTNITESIFYSRWIELINCEGFYLGISEMSRNWDGCKPWLSNLLESKCSFMPDIKGKDRCLQLLLELSYNRNENNLHNIDFLCAETDNLHLTLTRGHMYTRKEQQGTSASITHSASFYLKSGWSYFINTEFKKNNGLME